MVLKRENYCKSRKKQAHLGIELYTLQFCPSYFTSVLSELFKQSKILITKLEIQVKDIANFFYVSNTLETSDSILKV